MLQYVAVCCSVLLCVAVGYSVLQRVAVYDWMLPFMIGCDALATHRRAAPRCVVVCCSVLQCVAVYFSVLQCVAV